MGLFAALAMVVAAGPAHAVRSKEWGRDFGRLSFAVSGGFQIWTLTDVERAVDARAQSLAVDGYRVGADSFNPSMAYGGELQLRWNKGWFSRLELDWTRLSVEDRDRQYLQVLGAGPQPVSVGYETKVETHPILAALGLGHSWRNESLRWACAGNVLVAPMRIVDALTVYHDGVSHDSRIEATGTGVGGEVTVSLDYLTDTSMNVFVELFGRGGHTEVKLDNGIYESSILPGTRNVGLGGAGIRVGFRWI